MATSSKIDDSSRRGPRLRASTPANSIVDLRNLLAERFPHSRPSSPGSVKTGIAPLDQITDGGLAKHSITELSSSHVSAGSASLIYAMLQAANRDRYFLALIDGRDSFDPQPLGNSRLRNLLWIRCRNAMEGVKTADLLLRDGNFPVVIFDLVLNPAEELRKIPQTSWYRLQRLVELVPTAFLVLTRRGVVSSAQWKLTLENYWRLQDLESRDAVSRLKIHVQRIHGRQQIAEAH